MANKRKDAAATRSATAAVSPPRRQSSSTAANLSNSTLQATDDVVVASTTLTTDLSSAGNGRRSTAAAGTAATRRPEQTSGRLNNGSHGSQDILSDAINQPRSAAASRSSSAVSTSSTLSYDSRGAALYICAVVTLYALLVLLFVAILAAVNRRQRNRKIRRGDDDDYEGGTRKLARYLASVSKLREIGERGRRRRPSDVSSDRDVDNHQRNFTVTTIPAVSDRAKNIYETGNEEYFRWYRTASVGRNLSDYFNQYPGTQYAAGSLVGTASREGIAATGPCFNKDKLPSVVPITSGTGTYPGPRRPQRHRRGGSMDMLAEPTAADTSSVAVHVKQNRLPHPSTMRIGTTSQNVAQQRYQQQQQQQQHHHQQQLLQDRRRHESMGYCNAAMKQISPVDDVITLIQIDPADADDETLRRSTHHQQATVTAHESHSDAAAAAAAASPAVVATTTVTSPSGAGLQQASTSPLGGSSLGSRCRWSSGCNGDIWILQMEPDIEAISSPVTSSTTSDKYGSLQQRCQRNHYPRHSTDVCAQQTLRSPSNICDSWNIVSDCNSAAGGVSSSATTASLTNNEHYGSPTSSSMPSRNSGTARKGENVINNLSGSSASGTRNNSPAYNFSDVVSSTASKSNSLSSEKSRVTSLKPVPSSASASAPLVKMQSQIPLRMMTATSSDNDDDNEDLSDVIDMSVAHILNSCNLDPQSSSSSTSLTWIQRQRPSTLSTGSTAAAAAYNNTTSDAGATKRGWYADAASFNGCGAVANISDRMKLVPDVGGNENHRGSWSSAASHDSSLQSPAELQRLIHVTSV